MPHDLKIPDYVIERIMAKRGRLNVFDRFDPSKTALVVIDMQNFFVAEVDTAKSICPNINRLADAVRARGGVVAWVLLTVAEEMDGPSLWPIYHDYFFTPAKMKAHKDGLTEGSEGHRLYETLEVREEDLIARKSRFSTFIQGSSDLDERLRARGDREPADRRNGDQFLLRDQRAGRDDDRLPGDDGFRRERRALRRGPSGRADIGLAELRRRARRRRVHRRAAGAGRGGRSGGIIKPAARRTGTGCRDAWKARRR